LAFEAHFELHVRRQPTHHCYLRALLIPGVPLKSAETGPHRIDEPRHSEFRKSETLKMQVGSAS